MAHVKGNNKLQNTTVCPCGVSSSSEVPVLLSTQQKHSFDLINVRAAGLKKNNKKLAPCSCYTVTKTRKRPITITNP